MSAPAQSEQELSFAEARKLIKKMRGASFTAPYRGYAIDLGDGRLIACHPDGKFSVRLSQPCPEKTT